MLRILAHSDFQHLASLALWGGLVEGVRVVSSLFLISAYGQKITRNIILPHAPGMILVLLGASTVGLHGSLHVFSFVMFCSYVILDVGLWLAVDRGMFKEVGLRKFRLPGVAMLLMLVMFLWAWGRDWHLSITMSAVAVLFLSIVVVVVSIFHLRNNKEVIL